MNDGVEIVFGFPLVIEQTIRSGGRGQLSEAFPAISFPLNGAVGAVEFANAIARMLCLAVGLKLGKVGAFAVAFNSAVHG